MLKPVLMALTIGSAALAAVLLRPSTMPLERTDVRFSEVDGTLILDGEPFTGTVRSRHGTGQLREETEYVNGLKDGKEVAFHLNGRIIARRTYQAGRKHGLQESWYSTGQRFGEYHFAAGVPVGTAREWHVNGILKREQTFADGREAQMKAFFQTGEIHSNYVIRDGRLFGTVAEPGCPSTEQAELLAKEKRR